MIVSRTVTVSTGVEQVFAYLSDFTATAEWDSGTVRVIKVKGDGGVGTEYRYTMKFLGQETELTYVVTELRAPEAITLRGENASVVVIDTITIEATGAGTRVTYTDNTAFKGVRRTAAPLLRPALNRLADRAMAGLSPALENLCASKG